MTVQGARPLNLARRRTSLAETRQLSPPPFPTPSHTGSPVSPKLQFQKGPCRGFGGHQMTAHLPHSCLDVTRFGIAKVCFTAGPVVRPEGGIMTFGFTLCNGMFQY